jgi:hypothetical protein
MTAVERIEKIKEDLVDVEKKTAEILTNLDYYSAEDTVSYEDSNIASNMFDDLEKAAENIKEAVRKAHNIV